MSDPMRIRAQVQGSGAVVRVLMSHEMETGQRKDAAGKTIPAWHITEVVAALTSWMNQAGIALPEASLRWPVSISWLISTRTVVLSPAAWARMRIGSAMVVSP